MLRNREIDWQVILLIAPVALELIRQALGSRWSDHHRLFYLNPDPFWTLAVILLSPPAYFPLASFDRYLLADFPIFLALAAVLRDHPRARQIVLFTFAAVGAVAAVGYSRKVWIG